MPDQDNEPELHPPATIIRHNQPRRGVHHAWTTDRRTWAFRCGVVEPAKYAPAGHAALFLAEMSRLLSPAFVGIEEPISPPAPPLDLVTWPEAFLPAETLVAVLRGLLGHDRCPCIHVGLRPNALSDGTHLFTYAQLSDLVLALRGLSSTISDDLEAFAQWLAAAAMWGHYNVACVFMIDVDGALRVCLHPKNTASPHEISGLPDHTVHEADFGAVVTLAPREQAIYAVHLQPLICSDLLDLTRAEPGYGPRAALNADPQRFGPQTPEKLDIVSVVTCTPQANEATGHRPASPTWQPKFRSAFLAPLEGGTLVRHAEAVVVLSNVRTIIQRHGGLSGCYVPEPLPRQTDFGDWSRVWSWGRAGGDSGWSLLEGEGPSVDWKSEAHLVTLEPDYVAGLIAEDHMFAFTITRFPRARPRLERAATLASVEIRSLGRWTDTDGSGQ